MAEYTSELSGFADQLAEYRRLAEDWGSMGSERVLDRLTNAEDVILAHVAGLEAQLREARQMVAKDFWWWQAADNGAMGRNDLASLTCPIVISAEDMRTIFSRIEGLERNICRWVNGESDTPSEHGS